MYGQQIISQHCRNQRWKRPWAILSLCTSVPILVTQTMGLPLLPMGSCHGECPLPSHLDKADVK